LIINFTGEFYWVVRKGLRILDTQRR